MTEDIYSIQYRADISYIGTQFTGFQCQPDKKSVQDELERAFSVFFGTSIKIIGASRTDSGVHAYHQVITFKSIKPFDEAKWLRSLNSLVSPQIGIQRITPVDPNFHPIFHATAKIYRYRLCKGYCYDPFQRQFVWEVNRDINLEQLRSCAKDLIGSHDFTSFCATDGGAKTFAREILYADFASCSDYIDFWIIGRGFLKQMIRIIVGTLIDISQEKISLSINDILLARKREIAGRTAPAKGLTLMKVLYCQDDQILNEFSQLTHKF